MPLEINTEDFISVKGIKALGNQLSDKKVKSVELKEVLEYKEETFPESYMDIEVSSDETINSNDDESQITIEF